MTPVAKALDNVFFIVGTVDCTKVSFRHELYRSLFTSDISISPIGGIAPSGNPFVDIFLACLSEIVIEQELYINVTLMYE